MWLILRRDIDVQKVYQDRLAQWPVTTKFEVFDAKFKAVPLKCSQNTKLTRMGQMDGQI